MDGDSVETVDVGARRWNVDLGSRSVSEPRATVVLDSYPFRGGVDPAGLGGALGVQGVGGVSEWLGDSDFDGGWAVRARSR